MREVRLARRVPAEGPTGITGRSILVLGLEVTSPVEEIRPPFQHPFENPVSRMPVRNYLTAGKEISSTRKMVLTRRWRVLERVFERVPDTQSKGLQRRLRHGTR